MTLLSAADRLTAIYSVDKFLRAAFVNAFILSYDVLQSSSLDTEGVSSVSIKAENFCTPSFPTFVIYKQRHQVNFVSRFFYSVVRPLTVTSKLPFAPPRDGMTGIVHADLTTKHDHTLKTVCVDILR